MCFGAIRSAVRDDKRRGKQDGDEGHQACCLFLGVVVYHHIQMEGEGLFEVVLVSQFVCECKSDRADSCPRGCDS